MNQNNYKKGGKHIQRTVKANIEVLTSCGHGGLIIKLLNLLEQISIKNGVVFDWHTYNAETYEFYDAREIIKIINLKQIEMAKKKKENNKDYFIIHQKGLGIFKNEKTEDSVTIKSASGMEREYEFFESVSGKLAYVYNYEKEIVKADKTKVNLELFVIGITDEVDGKTITSVIETSFKGQYAQDFIMRLPNVNLTKDVALKPFHVKDKDKTEAKGKDIFNMGISISQPDVKETIKRYFTKDEKNGMPDMVKSEKKKAGKVITEWDTSERDEFLRNLVLSTNEKLKTLDHHKAQSELNNTSEAEAEETDAVPNAAAADDDLPF